MKNTWYRHSRSFWSILESCSPIWTPFFWILNDIRTLDQYTSQPIRLFHKSNYLDTELDFRQFISCFPLVNCIGCGIPERDSFPSLHFLGLAYAQLFRPVFLTCLVFSRFSTLNIPRYFLDFALETSVVKQCHLYDCKGFVFNIKYCRLVYYVMDCTNWSIQFTNNWRVFDTCKVLQVNNKKTPRKIWWQFSIEKLPKIYKLTLLAEQCYFILF